MEVQHKIYMFEGYEENGTVGYDLVLPILSSKMINEEIAADDACSTDCEQELSESVMDRYK